MSSALTLAEIERLMKHLPGLQRLDSGVRAPTTALQRRFVEVCRGRAKAITPHEVAYLKWRKAKPDLRRLKAEHEERERVAAEAARRELKRKKAQYLVERENKRKQELKKVAQQAEERAAREAATVQTDVQPPRIAEWGTRDDFRKDRGSWIRGRT